MLNQKNVVYFHYDEDWWILPGHYEHGQSDLCLEFGVKRKSTTPVCTHHSVINPSKQMIGRAHVHWCMHIVKIYEQLKVKSYSVPSRLPYKFLLTQLRVQTSVMDFHWINHQSNLLQMPKIWSEDILDQIPTDPPGLKRLAQLLTTASVTDLLHGKSITRLPTSCIMQIFSSLLMMDVKLLRMLFWRGLSQILGSCHVPIRE